MVAPGQVADGGFAGRHHRARLVGVGLAEEGLRLDVQREVAVVACKRKGGEGEVLSRDITQAAEALGPCRGDSTVRAVLRLGRCACRVSLQAG